MRFACAIPAASRKKLLLHLHTVPWLPFRAGTVVAIKGFRRTAASSMDRRSHVHFFLGCAKALVLCLEGGKERERPAGEGGMEIIKKKLCKTFAREDWDVKENWLLSFGFFLFFIYSKQRQCNKNLDFRFLFLFWEKNRKTAGSVSIINILLDAFICLALITPIIFRYFTSHLIHNSPPPWCRTVLPPQARQLMA